jgi:2-polyprenyl-3-methyl-5-hydroxy-6-metoxy-1,4-benzoquinol methylase
VERSEYEKLDIAEDRMWWFAAMHRNLLLLTRRVPVATATLPILDAGCGTGWISRRTGAGISRQGVLRARTQP